MYLVILINCFLFSMMCFENFLDFSWILLRNQLSFFHLILHTLLHLSTWILHKLCCYFLFHASLNFFWNLLVLARFMLSVKKHLQNYCCLEQILIQIFLQFYLLVLFYQDSPKMAGKESSAFLLLVFHTLGDWKIDCFAIRLICSSILTTTL